MLGRPWGGCSKGLLKLIQHARVKDTTLTQFPGQGVHCYLQYPRCHPSSSHPGTCLIGGSKSTIDLLHRGCLDHQAIQRPQLPVLPLLSGGFRRGTPGGEFSGEPHAIAYWNLIQEQDQGHWDVRFIKDGSVYKGY